MARAARLSRDDFGRRINYYLACVAESLSPIQRMAVRYYVDRVPQPQDCWRRGLIIGSHHIGDVLWRTASLEALNHALPNCVWYYLTSASSAPLLENNPYVAGVLPFYRGSQSVISKIDLKHLRNFRFDVALCTNKYSYGKELHLALRCGIPDRVSYVYKGLSALVTRPIAIRHPQPFPAYFREMVAELAGVAPTWPLLPKVYLTGRHEAEASEYLKEVCLLYTSPSPRDGLLSRMPSSA